MTKEEAAWTAYLARRDAEVARASRVIDAGFLSELRALAVLWRRQYDESGWDDDLYACVECADDLEELLPPEE